MDVTRILLDLAVILFSTKLLGMLMRKLGMPQIVGFILAGLLVGPAIWGLFGSFSPVAQSQNEADFLDIMAEIGVVMILFSAGLETDFNDLKRSGLTSTAIAAAGVTVPMALGFLAAVPFLGGFKALGDRTVVIEAVFIGVILTATSVGITVSVLKEAGRLRGKVGTTVLSAAIIDDVIGIAVLSVVMSFNDPAVKPAKTLVMTLLFFVFVAVVGVGVNFLFKWLAKRYPHKRRIPIFGLVLCFVYSFLAEKVFGIADITGAYAAGISLCGIKQGSEYIDQKIDVSSYMIFTPVFFANIGIGMDFSGFTPTALYFALAFVAAGVIGKLAGCAAAARACKFSGRQSLQIGAGMIARGEVALVVCGKGVAAGFFASAAADPMFATVALIAVTSLLTPVLLKLLFKNDKPGPLPNPDPLTPAPPTEAANAEAATGTPAETNSETTLADAVFRA
ncbi:MAG: cation:proton antiporter [Clostridiales bacterium]|jgi:Kef-type K+ transport system membrane component KefB|nr:cation:proton antiporter [Clostridiales bacterium]